MTTSTKSVLIAGRSPEVLDTALVLLSERGYRAQVTREFDDITARFDAAELDIVVFGGQVTPDQKAAMRSALVEANPDLEFLQGLAGIPGLIADQVDAAVAGETLIAGQAPTYDAAERTIKLVLFAPLEIKVIVYWVTELVPPNPKSASAVLADATLASGEHSVAIPESVVLDAAFATVRAGDAWWSFRLTAPAA
ncbi:MAG: hypothetical protein JWR63_661 [Conexibacter sp.]|nr:hypothetical protein [Conexibacter sp.]